MRPLILGLVALLPVSARADCVYTGAKRAYLECIYATAVDAAAAALGLDARLGDAESSLSTTAADLSSLQGTVAGLDAALAAAQDDIANLQGDLATAEDDLVSMGDSVSTLSTSLASTSASLAALDAYVDGLLPTTGGTLTGGLVAQQGITFADGLVQRSAANVQRQKTIPCNGSQHTIATFNGDGMALLAVRETGNGTGSNGVYMVSVNYDLSQIIRIGYNDRSAGGDDLQLYCTASTLQCIVRVSVADTNSSNGQCSSTSSVVVSVLGSAGVTTTWDAAFTPL